MGLLEHALYYSKTVDDLVGETIITVKMDPCKQFDSQLTKGWLRLIIKNKVNAH